MEGLSDSEGFEVERTMRDRLLQCRNERQNLRSEMDNLDSKIKYLIGRLKQKPRENDEQIVATMQAIEFNHATRPQTNVDERIFMREIDKLKKKRKELAEYNLTQSSIDELKARKSLLQATLKEKDVQLDELYRGVRTLRVARMLNCNPASLIEKVVPLPEEKVSQVIGRGGASIKNIEMECKVGIDSDRVGGCRLHIVGTSDGVDAAVSKIQTVLDTVTEELSLSDTVLICLLMDKAAVLQRIQDRCGARIDTSRSNKICKITGPPAEVALAVDEISRLDCARNKVPLDSTVLPFLLGKGGAIIRALQNDHKVHLEVDREALIVEIIGLRDRVEAASVVITDLINENKEIEDEIVCDRSVLLDVIVGAKGVHIRQLMKDLNVGLIVSKPGDDKDKNASSIVHETETVLIRGTTARVLSAKQHIADIIEKYNSESEVIPLPENCVAVLLGKKGARINAIREEFPNASIDVRSSSLTVRLHCTDTVVRDAARRAIQDIFDANAQLELPLARLTGISLKGNQGSSTRSKLQSELDLNFDIDTEAELIRFRGRAEKFPAAIDIINEFSDENFTLENIYHEEEFGSFLSGSKDGTLAKQIEKEFNVEMYFNRKNRTVRIVGKKAAVLSADESISRILHGDTSTGKSVVIAVNAQALGPLIGKGGSNIKEFETKNDVKLDVLRSRNQVRIRGTPDAVKEGTVALLKFIDRSKIYATVDIGEIKHNLNETDCTAVDERFDLENLLSQAHKADELFGTESTVPTDANSVVFSGSFRQVESAKRYMKSELTGIGDAKIPILRQHIDHFHDTMSSFTKLQENGASCGVEVSLSCIDEETRLRSIDETQYAICVKGPTKSLTKARNSIYRLLDYLFPAEFSSVAADAFTLRHIWNDSAVLYEFSKKFPDAVMSYDFPMSCIRFACPDSFILNQAVECVLDVVMDCKSRIAVMDVDLDVLQLLVSRNTSGLNRIEKRHQVTIELPKHGSCTVVMYGQGSSAVQSAKSELSTLCDTVARENWQMTFDQDIIGLLIGKQGANVRKLRAETKASIDIDAVTRLVKVSGKEDNVFDAKNRILKFVADRELENNSVELPIPVAGIPIIIGTKGATIREIKASTNIRGIDIDRENGVVVIKGRPDCCKNAATYITERLEAEGIMMTDNLKPRVTPITTNDIDEVEDVQSNASNRKSNADEVSKAPPKVPVGAPPDIVARMNDASLSKSSVRRLRRKLREQKNETVTNGGKDSDSDEEQTNNFESCSSNAYTNKGDDHEDAEHDNMKEFERVPDVPPHFSSTPSASQSHSSKSSANASRTDSPVVSTLDGVAGNILSMLLNSSPSSPHPTQSSDSAIPSFQHESAKVTAPVDYYKSKSGFAIRLE